MKQKIGADLSHHNGNVDYKKVSDSGSVSFVILRTGYSKVMDRKFYDHVKGFKSVGIPIVGVYHFSYAMSSWEAEQEAEFAVEKVKNAGLGEDTIIFYDFEYDSVNHARAYGITLTKKDCMAYTRAFCRKVKELGYRPGVYFNLDYKLNWYTEEFLKDYVCWIADWRVGKTYDNVAFHQYSNIGKISGIVGNVDLNYIFEDFVKMEVNPEKTITQVAREVLAGKYGNGLIRRVKLAAAGYDYATVQKEVNRLLRGG